MQIKYFLYYIILIIFLFNFGCSSKNTTIEPKKTIPLHSLYKEAYNNFEIGKYDKAVDIFEKVERDFSFTEWAPKALLMKSYIYYEANNYIRALTNLQKFKKRYPADKNFVYAEYLIAICLFEQINYENLSQENTVLALQQFNKILTQFPKSEYVNDAKLKINLINEQLAAKEMYLARYYIKRQKWTPAIFRLNNIITKYDNTIFTQEALHRLVEIHYKIGNINSAKKYASILGYNYNDSDWYKKSYNLVEGKNIPLTNTQKKISLKDKLMKLINLK